ncbi:hypothetical protein [Spirosoma koreense]
MIKDHFLRTLLLLTATASYAQVEYNTVQNVRIYAPTYKPPTDVQGSPYVPRDSVLPGWLVNGTKRIPAKLRYNSYSGEVEFLQGNRMVVPANAIAEFTILGDDTLQFHRGFPAVGSRSANDFYQLLYNGRRTKLLKAISTVIKTNAEIMHNDFGKKSFQKREEYYVWIAKEKPPLENYFLNTSEGEMKQVAANKKSLTNLFPQYIDQIDRYLSEQKNRLRSWTEFISALRYVETL